MQHIVVNLEDGVDKIISALDNLEITLPQKTNLLVAELASIGAHLAGMYFNVPYDGDGDVSVTWEERGDGAAAVVAFGSAVLFLEFGAGYLMGYGHPEPMGYGPGTYNPGSSNWRNPNGWYYGTHENLHHSYGNPPSAAMYNARKELEQALVNIAKGFLL